ncbi:Predicted type IV restriction endonuclease [Actinomyces bovis]|uniref:Predicted type IV restriction endonuclease n=1 Tax=Actinomyces bovis TaxID=1658 RepID=A0ABY1VNV4_9ACTO|nr:type I restriction enzyme HsdR N-terminal domain-containing protein [Actinomyces bovis]SPT53498.1 Predicted type IV restriction endonuclease [Actinomyces bovis]VEG55409.1 Predicted type IV restriction endonuclease [Actinomyces israelii]
MGTETRERLRKVARNMLKPAAELVARDANEGDTRLFVTDILCDALGYDKYSDLTTEYRVKGEFADYGIRVDQQLAAFVEVKRCTTRLNQRHLRQVEMYAVNEGVEWLVLTNGPQWQVYKLIAGLPVTIDLVLELDLLADGMTAAKAAAALFPLSKESFGRGQIEELWKERAATAPKHLAEVMLSEKVVDEARKELKRRTGLNVEGAELARLLRADVLRPDLVS